MQTKSRKFLSVLLALLMMAGVIAVAPITASAAGPIEVSTSTELGEAIDSAVDGDIIKLTSDITCSANLSFGFVSITIDLNGKTLTCADGLEIEDGELLLADPNNGALNVRMGDVDSTALYVVNGKAEVTSVSVTGDLMAAIGAGDGGEITVYGNVTCTGTTSGIGAYAALNSKITINGTLTVDSGFTYIRVEDTLKTQAQYEATSTYPYLTYKGTHGSDTSYVYVKDASAFKAVTVTGGTGSGNYLPSAAVAIVATVPAGQLFDKWTATGVTLTEAQKTNASTSFTMPNNAVSVTASFKDAKGIFGTKARWTGEWWHYLLFFACFGFIWMWFI